VIQQLIENSVDHMGPPVTGRNTRKHLYVETLTTLIQLMESNLTPIFFLLGGAVVDCSQTTQALLLKFGGAILIAIGVVTRPGNVSADSVDLWWLARAKGFPGVDGMALGSARPLGGRSASTSGPLRRHQSGLRDGQFGPRRPTITFPGRRLCAGPQGCARAA
jgi:hypothetical protein